MLGPLQYRMFWSAGQLKLQCVSQIKLKLIENMSNYQHKVKKQQH